MGCTGPSAAETRDAARRPEAVLSAGWGCQGVGGSGGLSPLGSARRWIAADALCWSDSTTPSSDPPQSPIGDSSTSSEGMTTWGVIIVRSPIRSPTAP